MTSKLTREKAQWLHDACEEAAAAGIKLTMNPNELLMFTSYALAAMDSEPVAYADPQAFENFEAGNARREWMWKNPGADLVALYRHAQPAPVAQCPYPCGWDTLNKLAIQDAAFVALALVAGEPATESIRSAVISNNDRLLKVISFCRDMMPQAGNSPVIGIDPASGPDCSVEVRYVAPPGYVMVPKDLLSELRDWAHPEIEKYCEMWEGRRDSEFPALRKVIADADALLAAAPQEVKP